MKLKITLTSIKDNTVITSEKEMLIPEDLDKNLLTYIAGNMAWDLLEKKELK